ncbi:MULTISPECIES: sulfur carrier protein ThiS [Thermomonospora]|uniref:Sulfur carrier protein n=1 Tax=Thermomonospora cellulosilytica TaxID=1411118 RepID=A0A7W3RBD6_9ACTN|nr:MULTISPECIES: sulfur carrier protein ThiS [Thermomonospora]MBA9006629.1 sulfur carrier protein [Thermomonospora cellulosilytica]
MKVVVNGEPRELPEGTTVAAVVASVTPAAAGVAVAVNDEVVGRRAWNETTVRDGDRVEVLTAVQGG